jgi:hypothetical protein
MVAKALIDVSQFGNAGYGDLTTMLDAAQTEKYKPRPEFEPLLAAFDALRSTPYGVTHLLLQFMASEQMPLAFSEIEKHATWITPSLISPKVRSLKIRERVLQILITNGGFLDLALHNEPHFSPMKLRVTRPKHRWYERHSGIDGLTAASLRGVVAPQNSPGRQEVALPRLKNSRRPTAPQLHLILRGLDEADWEWIVMGTGTALKCHVSV